MGNCVNMKLNNRFKVGREEKRALRLQHKIERDEFRRKCRALKRKDKEEKRRLKEMEKSCKRSERTEMKKLKKTQEKIKKDDKREKAKDRIQKIRSFRIKKEAIEGMFKVDKEIQKAVESVNRAKEKKQKLKERVKEAKKKRLQEKRDERRLKHRLAEEEFKIKRSSFGSEKSKERILNLRENLLKLKQDRKDRLQGIREKLKNEYLEDMHEIFESSSSKQEDNTIIGEKENNQEAEGSGLQTENIQRILVREFGDKETPQVSWEGNLSDTEEINGYQEKTQDKIEKVKEKLLEMKKRERERILKETNEYYEKVQSKKIDKLRKQLLKIKEKEVKRELKMKEKAEAKRKLAEEREIRKEEVQKLKG